MRSRAPTVLIVDDEPAVRRVLRTALRHLRCEVLEASDGLSALRIAKSQAFDLAIIDLQMPLLDGRAVCKQLSQANPTAIYALSTGYPDPDGQLAGELEWLPKPYGLADIERLLERTIRVDHDCLASAR